MDKKIQTTRDSINTLEGKLSVTLHSNPAFAQFCKQTFHGFDPEIYNIVAVRLYYSEETIMTLYALDKNREHKDSALEVKKFKIINPELGSIMGLIQEFNFTLQDQNYDLGDMKMDKK